MTSPSLFPNGLFISLLTHINVLIRTIMALWKAKSLTPEQKVQAVEEESEQKLQSEESGSFLGIDDVRFSEVYSLTLSVPVSFSFLL